MAPQEEDWSTLTGLARVPGSHDKVFNQECVFSFDTAESPGGLYICLEKFLALGQDFVQAYHERTGNALFLHVQSRRIPLAFDHPEDDDRVPEKVSRLAIGVPGGFNPDEKKYQLETQTRVVRWPSRASLPLDSPDLPSAIKSSAEAVLRAESAIRREELESAAGTWDGEKLEVSKFAHNLEQLNNGVRIPPKNWKCQRCDLTENLWLNLTDGSILCGRRFFDGSGGNNHAVEYYAEKKYPLAVKLGTITRDGQGDVFSYPEDNMVANPNLAKHMAHFGINIEQLDKTDKSMAEIEIDMNQRIGEWATLTESNSKLVPVYGPGLTGMENLGNTCYLNSLMQVLFTLPTFKRVYVEGSSAVFRRANFMDPINDFKLQMCKLGTGIWSGKYSMELSEDERKLRGDDFQLGIKPTTFKQMVGKGHPEFSGKNQQDAQEFFLHLCTMMEREHHGELNPAECLQFEVEDRIQCGTSGKVQFKSRVEDYVPLPIPVDEASNKTEVDAYEATKAALEAKGERVKDEDKVRPKISFEACLKAFLQEEVVEDFYSTAIQGKTFSKNQVRFKTFPDYLLIQLKKFDIGPNWQPYKLDVDVPMPDTIDLSLLQAKGIQPGEEELPVETTPAPEPTITPDASIVQQLVAMGFAENGCKKAAINTKNAGTEAAINWVMEHMGDADFADPIPTPKGAGGAAAFKPNEEALSMLLGMGMPEKKCIKALKETDNNTERAVDWIFSHPDDDGTMAEEGSSGGSNPDGGASSKTKSLTNGEPKYELTAFISHMGTSTLVGHYVCHIKKDGRWVIFNDKKVALSENPPKGLGYLYLYKRADM